MYNCLGLYEYIKEKETYTESVYCINDKITLYSVSRKVFHRFVGRISHEKESLNPFSMEKSAVKTNASL